MFQDIRILHAKLKRSLQLQARSDRAGVGIDLDSIGVGVQHLQQILKKLASLACAFRPHLEGCEDLAPSLG
eukprot:m.111450 g.111450  ORF g.111450 m.111450 type:complete len:71 (-) comp21368_c0_seq2:5952-6164(-)